MSISVGIPSIAAPSLNKNDLISHLTLEEMSYRDGLNGNYVIMEHQPPSDVTGLQEFLNVTSKKQANKQ